VLFKASIRVADTTSKLTEPPRINIADFLATAESVRAHTTRIISRATAIANQDMMNATQLANIHEEFRTVLAGSLNMLMANTSTATSDFVFRSVFSKFQSLHSTSPSHAIFGTPEKGKIRAPLTLVGSKEGSLTRAISWEKKCRALAVDVEKKMGAFIYPESCWLRDDQAWVFNRRSEGKVETLHSVLVVRLLAFLADPSEQSWEILVGESGGRIKGA
jgi:hypothetical protein